jgi:hypothetical protein
MKKDLIIQLVKVANNLDEMGFSKEANHLDKIASKIVVSFASTEKYTADIKQFKALVMNGKQDEADTLLFSVLDGKEYSEAQKKAFRHQANSIEISKTFEFDVEKANDKLSRLLKRSDFQFDTDGTLNSATNINEFTNFWIHQIQPAFSRSYEYEYWLTQKFLILKKSLLAKKRKAKEVEDSKKSWWQRTFGQ